MVALSSTEAKYIGIAHAAKEAIWVRHLLSELYSPLQVKAKLVSGCWVRLGKVRLGQVGSGWVRLGQVGLG